MFGGFGGVLPIRLGGAADTGWTATQHARQAADAVATDRVAPLASMTIQVALAGSTVISYHGRNGTGLANAPVVDSLSTGTIRVTWGNAYRSEVFRGGLPVSFPWVIRTAVVCGHWNAAPVIATIIPIGVNSVIGPVAVKIEVRKWNGSSWALSDEQVTLRVFGDWIPEARIGDYDGAPDKVDCNTETDPYSWLWYQEYTAMLGSAFSSDQRGIVHAKKLTLARFEAGKTRAAERARANAIPSTADDCLGLWVKALAVPYRDSDQKWQIRQRCAAKLKGALGPTQANVDASLIELLGTQFVSTIHQTGTDLDHPPALTNWPGVNPGPIAMDLGGGAWFSERAHITVLVVKPPPTQLGEFLYQTNVALFQHLDRMLPAKCSFNWTTSIQGFLLDGAAHADGTTSQLDFDGLIP